MTLKYTNQERTAAEFNGSFFTLSSPEDWDSVGTGPTREAVKAWLAGGNEPEPYIEPPKPLPTIVTMRQARLALLQAGLLDQVNTAIDSLPSPNKEVARIEWEYSQTVERNRPLVSLLGPALGLSDAKLDQLFVTAAGL